LDAIISGRVVIETSPGDDCIQCQIPVLLAFRVTCTSFSKYCC